MKDNDQKPNQSEQDNQRALQAKIDVLRYAGFTPVQIESLIKVGAIKP